MSSRLPGDTVLVDTLCNLPYRRFVLSRLDSLCNVPPASLQLGAAFSSSLKLVEKGWYPMMVYISSLFCVIAYLAAVSARRGGYRSYAEGLHDGRKTQKQVAPSSLQSFIYTEFRHRFDAVRYWSMKYFKSN